MPELAHLTIRERERMWRHCREHVYPKLAFRDLLPVCLCALPVVISVAIFQFGGLSWAPAFFLLNVVTVVAVIYFFWRLRRRALERAIRAELLAQFHDRQLPGKLTTIRCPECDYNLAARTADCTRCPECGWEIRTDWLDEAWSRIQ